MKCEPLCKSLHQQRRAAGGEQLTAASTRPSVRPPSHQPPPPPSRVSAARIRTTGPTYPCSHALNASERVQTHRAKEYYGRTAVSALQSRTNLVPRLGLRHGPTDRPTHWFRASRHDNKFSAHFALPRNSARPEDASRNVKTVCWTGHECVDQSCCRRRFQYKLNIVDRR